MLFIYRKLCVDGGKHSEGLGEVLAMAFPTQGNDSVFREHRSQVWQWLCHIRIHVPPRGLVNSDILLLKKIISSLA